MAEGRGGEIKVAERKGMKLIIKVVKVCEWNKCVQE